MKKVLKQGPTGVGGRIRLRRADISGEDIANAH